MPVFSCEELQLLQREIEKNVKNPKEKVLKLCNSGKINLLGGWGGVYTCSYGGVGWYESVLPTVHNYRLESILPLA